MLDARIDGLQQIGRILQEGRTPPQRLEQRLPSIGAHPRMRHVQRQHAGSPRIARILGVLKADQERLAPHHRRHVPGVPAVVVEKEVLPFLKAEQRHRVEAAVRILLKQDRVERLDVAELEWKGGNLHHGVAVAGGPLGDDAHVLVIDVVQQREVSHGQACPDPRCAMAPSSSRFDGNARAIRAPCSRTPWNTSSARSRRRA